MFILQFMYVSENICKDVWGWGSTRFEGRPRTRHQGKELREATHPSPMKGAEGGHAPVAYVRMEATHPPPR